MKNILLISARPGAGVMTIAVNLATGLARCGSQVLISSFQSNPTFTTWLQGSRESANGLLECYANLKLVEWPEFLAGESNLEKSYDYWLGICGGDLEKIARWKGKELQVLCIFDAVKDASEEIITIERKMRQLSRELIGIDLLVPNKVHPGEWKKSSDLILDLSNQLGWEKVADPIPFCEAIHDLPKERKSVWELPDYYNNRKQAFQSLLERVRNG